MADHVVQYVARANKRNIQGYALAFEVVSGRGPDGDPIFTQSRAVTAGRKVLVLHDDPATNTPTGTVYLVRQGEPMRAVEAQPLPGQKVTVTCSRADLPYQAGAIWTKLDDGSFVDQLWSIEDRLDLAKAPVTGPTPPLQPEG